MKEENLKQLIKDFCESPFFDFEIYNLPFEEVALNFLLFLLHKKLIIEQEVSIGIFYEDESKRGSIICFDEYNSDVTLNLKLYDEESFEIELTYYNSDQEYQSYVYKLAESDKVILPSGLINLMQEVKRDQKSRVVTENNLQEVDDNDDNDNGAGFIDLNPNVALYLANSISDNDSKSTF